MALCHVCKPLHDRAQPLDDEVILVETTVSNLGTVPKTCEGICRYLKSRFVQIVDKKHRDRTTQLVIGAGKGSSSHFRVQGTDDHYNETFTIELYTDTESATWPWNIFYVGTSIDRWSGSKAVLNRCRSWLEHCNAKHSICQTQKSFPSLYLPYRNVVRILDCRNNLLRLVEGFDVSLSKFAALSHCWGDAKHITTTATSLPQHLKNIPRAVLPPTFRQAVEVCEHLGIDFLWIDSLCIVQDDFSDRSREASKMGAVYQAAELVISADGASNSAEGLFKRRLQAVRSGRPSSRRSTIPASLYGRPTIEHAQHLSGQVDMNEREPLFQRAWAVQEWLLAQRVLHFGRREVVWDCLESLDCECGGFARMSSAQTKSAQQHHLRKQRALRGPMIEIQAGIPSQRLSEVLNTWLEIVSEHTSRGLTKYSDRLIAIDGLAHTIEFYTLNVRTYTNGLFCGSSSNSFLFVLQMLWLRVGASEDSEPHLRPDPLKAVAPTWSWASIDEAVGWLEPLISWLYDEQETRVVMTARVDLDHSLVSPVRPSAYNQGTVRVKTQVLQGEVQAFAKRDRGQGLLQLHLPGTSTTKKTTTEIVFSLDVNLDQELKSHNLTVYCARLLDYTKTSTRILDLPEDSRRLAACLVLKRSSNPGWQSNYERIGVITDQVPAEWFSGSPRRNMIIW